MTINELVAAYVAGRITEEVFRKLLAVAEKSEYTSTIYESVQDSVEDFMDLFDW